MKTFSEMDVQAVRPLFDMMTKTGVISTEKSREMLAALISFAKNSGEDKRPKFLTRKQVADYLQVSTVQVDRLAKQGML